MRIVLGRGLFAASALTASVIGCSAPGKGALVLAISTDLQAPKDADVVSVFVSSNAVPKLDYLGRVRPDGTVALPSTLAIVEPDDPGEQVRIRVTLFKEGTPKVLRDVLTTVPHQRTALLRIPLDFIDLGSATGSIPAPLVPRPGGPADGPTRFDPTDAKYLQPTCDFDKEGLTMIDGACHDATVESSQLPSYAATDVFGEAGLQPSGAPTACFDVARCFAGASPVAVDESTCSFALPTGADPASFNVAIATASTGACLSAQECLVPLESGPGSGWSVSGRTVTLPAAVCARFLAAGAPLGPTQIVAGAGACPAQTASDPVCEPFDSDGGPSIQPDAGTPALDAADGGEADAGPVADADATLDDSPDGASVDATLVDDASPEAAAACEAGLTACGAACVDTTADPNNCGSCGTPCSGTCALGHCSVILLTENESPGRVVVQGANLYWTDSNAGTVLSAPVGGGPIVTVASGQFEPAQLVADQSNLYWSTFYSIEQMALDGGAPSSIASAGAMGGVGGIAVDGTNVYWTGVNDGTVSAVPVGGGVVTTLAAGGAHPSGIALAPPGVVWGDYQTGAILSVGLDGGAPVTLVAGGGADQYGFGGFAADSTNVYWGSSNGLFTATLDGGAPTSLVSGAVVNDLAIDSTQAYYATTAGILSVPLDGGASTVAASIPNNGLGALVATPTRVYFDLGGSVDSVPLDGGAITTIAPGAYYPRALRATSTGLYVDLQSGPLVQLPLAGGTPVTLTATLSGGSALAVDSTAAYTASGGEGLGAALVRVPLDGGAPVTLATDGTYMSVASDGTHLYIAGASYGAGAGSIQSIPVLGGTPTTLATTTSAAGIAIDGNNVYWTDTGNGASDAGSVAMCALSGCGGTPVTLATAQTSPGAITVDGTNVYWVDTGPGGATGSIMACPIAGCGGVPTTLATGQNGPGGIAVDGPNVYWVDMYGSASVLRVPVSGGAVSTLATGDNANAIAILGGSVYVTGNLSGNLRRITPE